MTEEKHTPPLELGPGLSRVRQRRWLLWVSILIYVPGLLVTLELNASGATMAKLFGGWIGLLCCAVALATVVKCPKCQQNFHTNGPTFLPVRKCVHCGLPLNADKAPGSL